MDKIFFDLDGEQAFEEVKKLHNDLTEKQLMHLLVFSGNGFHVYVFVKVNNSLAPREKSLAIRNFALSITNNYKSLDLICVGDLARLARIPNTFNFKAKRFCIPITEEDLEKGLDFIKAKATKQQDEFVVYGKKLVDLSNYVNLNLEPKRNMIYNGVDLGFVNLNQIIKMAQFPPFLLKLIALHKNNWIKTTGWRDRYLLILWMREKGFTEPLVLQALKLILTPEEYNHCVFLERQPYYIFKERSYDVYLFPKAETLKLWGYDITQGDEYAIAQLYKLS